jgi:hypothetical protein
MVNILNVFVFILLLINQLCYPFPYEVILFFEHGVIRPRNGGEQVLVLFSAFLVLINWIVVYKKRSISPVNIYILCFLSGVCISQIRYTDGAYSEEIIMRYEIESSWDRYDKK